jgi:alkanesulfonate monooxygenase SsuD/methylene tetrahydromethanopterin reductase-like flavin-dependent oxidoreductase (luciferase family)
MRTLWRDRASTYRGKFVNFERAYSFPKPARGNIAVLFGGETEVMLKRVARLGDGWIPVRLGADRVRDVMTKIRRYAEEYGTDARNLKVVAHMFLQAVTPDDLKHYRDAGVDEFVLSAHGQLPTASAALQDRIADLARRYIDPLK